MFSDGHFFWDCSDCFVFVDWFVTSMFCFMDFWDFEDCLGDVKSMDFYDFQIISWICFMGCFWIVESTPGMAVIESTFYWSSFWSFLNMFFSDVILYALSVLRYRLQQNSFWYAWLDIWVWAMIFRVPSLIASPPVRCSWTNQFVGNMIRSWTSTWTCGVAKFGSESTDPKPILINPPGFSLIQGWF